MNDTMQVSENVMPFNIPPEIIDLMQQCIQVQNDGKATVFIEVAGHIKQLSIRFYAPEWKSKIEHSFSKSIYLDDEFDNTEKYRTDFISAVEKYIQSLY